MHDFALRNPDDIKKQLDDYADVMCETLYNFRRLEEHKKILLAQLSINENINEVDIIVNNELNITISNEDDNRLFDEDKLHRIMTKIQNLDYDSE